MQFLTSERFQAFVTAKPAAAIHFDADWDARPRDLTRAKMLEAEIALGDQVNFAEIDVDSNVSLCEFIRVRNIPLVAYYREGRLVAALIGAGQNVRARVERVLRGESIGYEDGTDKE